MTENRKAHFLRIVAHVVASARPMPNGTYPLAACVTHVTIMAEMFRRGFSGVTFLQRPRLDGQVLQRLCIAVRADFAANPPADGTALYWAESACVNACEAIRALTEAVDAKEDLETKLKIAQAIEAAAYARYYNLCASGAGPLAPPGLLEVLGRIRLELIPRN